MAPTTMAAMLLDWSDGIYVLEMDTRTRDDYREQKIKHIEQLNMIGVLIFVSYFSSFVAYLRTPLALGVIHFAASILEAAAILLILGVVVLETCRPKYCRNLLTEYPVVSLLLLVSNSAEAVRYMGRVTMG